MIDAKPQRPVKDPQLLAALKSEWREHGCAICGCTVPEPDLGTSIPLGFDVELHHLDRGRRPDERMKIIGLCGEFLNGCHSKVTRNDLVIFRDAEGVLSWRVTIRHGAALRLPHSYREEQV